MSDRRFVESEVGGVRCYLEVIAGQVVSYYARNPDGGIGRQFRVGQPLEDSLARFAGGVTGSGLYVPPGVGGIDVTWEAPPSFSLKTSNATIEGGTFWNQSATKAAFDMGSAGGYDSRYRLILRNSIVRTTMQAFKGFRCRLELDNVLILIDPPTVYGKSASRPIEMPEFVDCDLKNVTIIGGGQCYFSGLGSSGRFYGNPYNGEGFKAFGMRSINVDGRRSDGFGGYIRSNWANGHVNTTAFKNLSGAEVGWDIGNWVQFDKCYGMILDVEFVETLYELGKARTEDTLSLFGGTGCLPQFPGRIQDVHLDTSGGWDWTYDPDYSTSYNPSGYVLQGATSPQSSDIMDTRQSGTAIIFGDSPRSLWAENTSNIVSRRVTTSGARGFIKVNYAHDLTFDACVPSKMGRHWSGVPYSSYYDGGWDVRTKDTLATYVRPDGTTEQREIFGGMTMTNNLLMSGSGPLAPYTFSAAQMISGGTQSGNQQVGAPADGGRQLIRDLRGRAAAAGVTIGYKGGIPRGWNADPFAPYM